ncbi:hypothetical protein [Polyangium jinanense]|uniref:Uncharacterized protein n=1 Tax=Polyangium jinanense TaxID=2829994 RepID=A0A9X3XCU4_9BACT|nr:hypothetical protein [Polyangium jinanense]MDC3958424.1 hypothetical protein [Polyangium jinanense]MDC3987977.1 hypothetical protein [Polyangium jinanense]
MSKTRGAKVGGALRGGAMIALLLGLGAAGCGLLKQEEPEKKAFGVACTKDTDCASLQCAATGSICTKSCTYDRDCGDGLVCRAKDTGSGLECSKSVGAKIGASCATAGECDHGFCLKKADAPNEPGFCSATCQGPAECPDGYKICDTLTASDTTKMCILGDDRIPIGERPKFTAPTTTTVKTTPTATATATATSTASATPTATSTASATPTATSTASATPTATASTGRPRIKLDLGKTKK